MREHKQLTIKMMMGHAPMTPVEAFAAKSGKFLNERKLEREVRDMENPELGLAGTKEWVGH
jgi:hypothetical protein